MAISRTYTRIEWENEPSLKSPINATNLNHMDNALYTIDGEVVTLDINKAEQSELLTCLSNVDYNTTTGVFTFTFKNGTTVTADLNIEKIPVTFSMDANGVITMTTADGTQYTADVGALIKTYSFSNSDRISFTVTTDASGNKTVVADIIDGSITGAKLQPNYLADCQLAKTDAETAAGSAGVSATAASGSSVDSEAFANGTRNGVPITDPTDPAYQKNARYWADSSHYGVIPVDPQDTSDYNIWIETV